jgi:hypothetical protein
MAEIRLADGVFALQEGIQDGRQQLDGPVERSGDEDGAVRFRSRRRKEADGGVSIDENPPPYVGGYRRARKVFQ